MDNELETIQHLNGNTYQHSAYKDEFILAQIESRWREEGKWGGERKRN